MDAAGLKPRAARETSMTRVAFIGLGNMGAGMAANQVKAGREVQAFDLSGPAVERRARRGARPPPAPPRR